VGIAVVVGVILSSLNLAWQLGEKLNADAWLQCRPIETSTEEDCPKDAVAKTVELEGQLCFSSVDKFATYFDPANDPDKVELHLGSCDIEDFSAMAAIDHVGEQYRSAGKELVLRRVKAKHHKRLQYAKSLLANVEIEFEDAPLASPLSLNVTHFGQHLGAEQQPAAEHPGLRMRTVVADNGARMAEE